MKESESRFLEPVVDSTPQNRPKKISRRDFLKRSASAAVGAYIGISGLERAAKAAEQESQDLTDHQIMDRWNECKRLFQEHPELKENIVFLEETYGEGVKPFLMRAKAEIAAVESFIKNEEEATRQGLKYADVILKSPLRGPFAKDIAGLMLYWNRENLEKVARSTYETNMRDPQALIKGFEKHPDLDNVKVKAIIDRVADSRWAYGNISGFEYDPDPSKIDLGGQALGRGLPDVFDHNSGEKIVLYNVPRSPNAEGAVERYTMHEGAHRHDWEHANTLTMPERIQLLVEVTKRLDAPNHIDDYYVYGYIPEHERYKDMDPKDRKYTQAVEFYAELMSQFDEDSEKLRREHLEDFEFASQWRSLILSRYGEKVK